MQRFSMANYFDIMTQSQKLYGRCLEPICKTWDLTRNELDILLFLYNNPEYDRAADIVARRGIAKSHVSLSVASLEGKALLLRQFSREDRRTAHLKLTELGNRIAAEGRVAQKHFFNRLYAGISEEEMLLWRKITVKVCENIENFEKNSTNI